MVFEEQGSAVGARAGRTNGDGTVPAADAADAAGAAKGTLPSVDVVIPTRDRPELLRRAIKHVVGQRYEGAINVTVVFDQSDVDLSIEMQEPLRSVRVVVISCVSCSSRASRCRSLEGCAAC